MWPSRGMYERRNQTQATSPRTRVPLFQRQAPPQPPEQDGFLKHLRWGSRQPGGSHEHQCTRTGSLRIAWQAQLSSGVACAPPRAPGVPLGRRRSSASPSIQLGAREGHKQGTGPREASQPHRWSQGPASPVFPWSQPALGTRAAHARGRGHDQVLPSVPATPPSVSYFLLKIRLKCSIFRS